VDLEDYTGSVRVGQALNFRPLSDDEVKDLFEEAV
jgi:hypothetical protein